MHKEKAFTLVELMIVVLIIGVLVSIAVPTYMRQMDRSKASKAVSHLDIMRKGLVEYYYENDRFTTLPSDLTDIVGSTMPPADDDWTYGITVPTTSTFTVQATRIDGQYSDQTITVDHNSSWAGSYAGPGAP